MFIESLENSFMGYVLYCFQGDPLKHETFMDSFGTVVKSVFRTVFHFLVNIQDTMQLMRHAWAACRTIACTRSANKRRWRPSKYKRYFVGGIYGKSTEEENWMKVVFHENLLVTKCYSIRGIRDEKLESIFMVCLNNNGVITLGVVHQPGFLYTRIDVTGR